MNKTVEAFIAQNDQSPVVAAYTVGDRGGLGAVYVFKDDTRKTLGAASCAALPDGYPKWDLPLAPEPITSFEKPSEL